MVYYYSDNKRSHHIKNAVLRGAKSRGYKIRCIHEREYSGDHYDVAIFYGLINNLKQIQKDYSLSGKTSILLDLGYWGRHDGGRLEGYHRIAINGLHGAGFVHSGITLPNDRVKKFKINPCRTSIKDDGYILLCGQSAKAAWVYDMEPEQWEKHVIRELKHHTDREIVYWPKNTWPDKRPLEGASYDNKSSLSDLIPGAYAVLGHHSNSCMHALLSGKPIYLDDGIAHKFSIPYLSSINEPTIYNTEDLQQFVNKVSYCQWQVEEIRNGSMFKFLSEVGVL